MTIEQLIQLEDDRMATMASQAYQEWVKNLNVSRLYVNPEPSIRARHLNEQYDYSKKETVAGMIKSIYL